MKIQKSFKKKYSHEIKSKIKLEDESLKFKDDRYFYWSKTVKIGNYPKYLRQKIGTSNEEIYFDGDEEKKLSGYKIFWMLGLFQFRMMTS